MLLQLLAARGAVVKNNIGARFCNHGIRRRDSSLTAFRVVGLDPHVEQQLRVVLPGVVDLSMHENEEQHYD
jgi:hypothetical protein